MAIVTTADMETRFRLSVDDVLRGPADAPDVDALWSSAEVQQYMADAVDKVACEVLSLFSTFNVAVTANQPLVTLPASKGVLDIKHVLLVSNTTHLHPRNVDDGFHYINDYQYILFNTEWEAQSGTPQFYIRDYVPGKLRLVPIPTVDDTLTITASVSPPLVTGAPLPFTNSEELYCVLLWMRFLAYSKKDADTYDPEQAKLNHDLFFEAALDRKYEAQRTRHAPRPAKFHW